jgi:hypothetical protein
MAPRKPITSPVQKFVTDLRSGKIKEDDIDIGGLTPSKSTLPAPSTRRTPSTSSTTSTPTTTPPTTTGGGTTLALPSTEYFNSPAFRAFTSATVDARRSGADAAEAGRIARGEEKDWGQKFMGGLGQGIQKIIEFDIIPDTIPLTRYLPGRGDTNIGVPGPKEIRPIKFVADPTLRLLGVIDNTVLSTLKEIRDWKNGGSFSGKDWLRQTVAAPTKKVNGVEVINPDYLTYGGLTGNIVDPDSLGGYGKWVNRLLGLSGTIFLSPVNLFTGPGGLSKTAVASGVRKGATEAAELAAAAAVKKGALEALETSARGDIGAGLVANARTAADTAAELALEATKKVGTKDLKVAELGFAYQAAERELALARQSGNAARIEVATANFEKALNAVSRYTPRSTRGRGARQAMAIDVANLYDEAKDIARLTPEELAARGLDEADQLVAQRFTEVITPEVQLKIGERGMSAVRGEIAEVLGRRGGPRFGLPFGPKYNVFGKPGEKVFNALGEAFTVARVGNPSSRVLSKVAIVGKLAEDGLMGGPIGKKFALQVADWSKNGLWNEAAMKEIRASLQTGRWAADLPGATADDFVLKQNAIKFLQLDARMKALVGEESSRFASTLAKAFPGGTRRFFENEKIQRALKDVDYFMVTPESQWVRPMTDAEKVAMNRINFIKDTIQSEVEIGYKSLGFKGELPKLGPGIPRIMTKNATEFAAKNPRLAEKVFDAFRTLKPKTIEDANMIAKDILEGEFKFKNTIRFNWYEPNALAALDATLKANARDLAYMRLIGEVMQDSDSVFRSITKETPITPALLTDYRFVVDNMFTPEDVARFRVEDVNNLLARMDEVKKIIGGPYATKPILKAELDDAMLQVQDALERAKAGAFTPEEAALVLDEANNLFTSLMTKSDDIERLWNAALQRPDRWKTVTSMIDEGMTALGFGFDVQVNEAVAEMWRNARRLSDPEFANATEKFFNSSLNLWKANKTASLGFTFRNLLGDTFQMITAGANPKKLVESIYILKKYKTWLASRSAMEANLLSLAFNVGDTAVDDGLNRLRTLQMDEFINTLPEKLQVPARTAIEGIGAAAFGQMAEAIGGVPIKSIGVLGVPTTSNVSRALGTPLRAFGGFAETMQNYSRFALLYDGVSSGLSPVAAAARVNKFLINYQDISTVDQRVKKYVPFWMFFSRNLPLQVENMWMNPQAYNLYNKSRQALEDDNQKEYDLLLNQYYGYWQATRDAIADGDKAKEQKYYNLMVETDNKITEYSSKKFAEDEWVPAYIPQWITETGGWRIGGTDIVVRPPFGGPGMGELPFEETLNPLSLAGRLRPELRLIYELVSGEKVLTGEKVYDPERFESPMQETFKYIFRESPIGAPGVQYGRYASALGGAGIPGVSDVANKATANEVAVALLGTRAPKTNEDEYIDAQYQTFLSFIGSPLFPLTDAQQRSELWRRTYQLKDLIDKQKASK